MGLAFSSLILWLEVTLPNPQVGSTGNDDTRLSMYILGLSLLSPPSVHYNYFLFLCECVCAMQGAGRLPKIKCQHRELKLLCSISVDIGESVVPD